jgi:hypothetical protein
VLLVLQLFRQLTQLGEGGLELGHTGVSVLIIQTRFIMQLKAICSKVSWMTLYSLGRVLSLLGCECLHAGLGLFEINELLVDLVNLSLLYHRISSLVGL